MAHFDKPRAGVNNKRERTFFVASLATGALYLFLLGSLLRATATNLARDTNTTRPSGAADCSLCALYVGRIP